MTELIERLAVLREQLWLAAKIEGSLTPTMQQVDDFDCALDKADALENALKRISEHRVALEQCELMIQTGNLMEINDEPILGVHSDFSADTLKLIWKAIGVPETRDSELAEVVSALLPNPSD